jgi:DNA polymerase-3 subunit delta
MVKELVSESAANSLQLAIAIRLNNIAQALEFGDSEALLQAVCLINI